MRGLTRSVRALIVPPFKDDDDAQSLERDPLLKMTQALLKLTHLLQVNFIRQFLRLSVVFRFLAHQSTPSDPFGLNPTQRGPRCQSIGHSTHPIARMDCKPITLRLQS
jgi:hypothetical protein